MRNSILKYRKWIILWISPILLSVILFLSYQKENKCVFVVSLMVIYWLTEAVPLAVTALIPLFLFPLFGIMSTKQVSKSYINDTLMVFLGSIIATVAVEESNLHQRIALRILMFFGTSPVWLLLGFMSTTSFISMWISDTATTALMVPIIEAVMSNIKDENKTFDKNKFLTKPSVFVKKSLIIIDCELRIRIFFSFYYSVTLNAQTLPNDLQLEPIGSNKKKTSIKIRIEKEKNERERSYKLMRRVIYLAVTFSSLIGGTGTITGTTTNMIFKGMTNDLVGDNITFANWMLFSIPGLIINVVLIWIYMILIFARRLPKFSGDSKVYIKQYIRTKYISLGSVSFHEMAVLVMFSSLLILWFFRDPDFFMGWSPALYPQTPNYINDASAAMFIVFLCFLIPANPRDLQNSKPLMTWRAVQERVPWGVFLLMGGAFAMSSGIMESGLSKEIGSHLTHHLQHLSPLILSIIVSILSMFFTEVSSNAATSTVFLPIVKHLAESLGISPLRFMLPVTVVSSFAFMFPAGAPSNAIVYEAAQLKIPEMAIPGFFAKFICLSVVILSTNTWGYVIYNMHDLQRTPSNDTLITISH